MGLNQDTENCLLIVPPFQSGKGSILKSFNYSMPPIGLLSIAAYLRQNGVQVSLLDFSIEDTRKFSVEEILASHVEEHGTPAWIGISVCTPVAYNAYEVAKICKEVFPKSNLLLGGPHVTVLGNRVFSECAEADYLITGEGEYALCDLILKSDITADNILCRETKRVSEHPAEEVDISTLPMPAYDLLKFELYVPPPASLQSRQPGIGIITSRGCPFKCTFCTKISGSKLRLIPIPMVIEQIKMLQQKFHIRQFHFYDDTITCNRKYITDFCETMLRDNMKLHWSCFARVDTVDEDLLRLMRKAGCFVIMYGAESLDENVLKSFQKGITVPQIQQALVAMRKSRIESRISLVIGSPAETWESIRKTHKEVLKLKADFLQVFIAVPMPGSQFYREAKAENRVISENWADYNLSKVLYHHPVFNEKELFKWQRKFYLSFYLRFGVIFRLLGKVNSWYALKNVWTGFKGFVKIVGN